VALPEREVERVPLARLVLVGLALLARLQLGEAAVRELPVAVEAAHAEVHVAGAGVGVAAVDERLDQVDDLGDRLAGERLAVRPAQRQPVRVGGVRRGHLARQLIRRDASLVRGGVDLVVDVRDVHDKRHVVSLVAQEPAEQREHDVRAGVADVDPPVDRRAANVDPDPSRVARIELAQAVREGVVQPDRGSRHRPGA